MRSAREASPRYSLLDSAQRDSTYEMLLHGEEREGDGTDGQHGDRHLGGERGDLDAERLRARLQDRDVGGDLIQQVLERHQGGIVYEEQREVPVIPVGKRAKQRDGSQRGSRQRDDDLEEDRPLAGTV